HEAKQLDKAIDVLERANRQMPDIPEIKYDLGMLLVQNDEDHKFELLMREIIELDPEHANAYNALGYIYADQNRNLDEAQNLLEQAMDLEAAVEYLARSYEQLPAADVAAHLGEVLWVKGRKDDARKVWQEGLDADPDNDTLQETLDRFNVHL